jgi:hypothetical protein
LLERLLPISAPNAYGVSRVLASGNSITLASDRDREHQITRSFVSETTGSIAPRIGRFAIA